MTTPDRDLYKPLVRISNLTFDVASQRYRIQIPPYANIGSDTIGRQASGPNAKNTALIFEDLDGLVQQYTFAELNDAAIRLAVGLRQLGVVRGDTIAVHTGQRPETAITHIATYYLGCIALTLSQLYGPDTIEHVLTSSGCKVLITDINAWKTLREHRHRFKSLTHCIVNADPSSDELQFSFNVRGIL